MTRPISFTKFRLALPPPIFRRSCRVKRENYSIRRDTNQASIYAPINKIEQTPEQRAYMKEAREMRRIKEQFLEAEEARKRERSLDL